MLTSLNDVPDHFTGLTKRERQNVVLNAWRKRMISAGRCRGCGKVAVTKSFCRACADKKIQHHKTYLAKKGMTAYQYFRQYYDKRLESHNCVYCGVPLPKWWKGRECTNCYLLRHGRCI